MGFFNHAECAQFWENGNFLVPAPFPGGFALVDTGERYGSWKVVGEPGNVSWTSGTRVHDGFSFPAQGNPTQAAGPWVNLAGISRSRTGIMHGPVPTTVGQPYKLSFYVGNIVDPGHQYGTSSTVHVFENATEIAVATNSNGSGTTVENWKPFSVTFNATDPYTTIVFINGDAPDDMNCGLSNTVFGPSKSASQVPTP